MMLNGNFLTLFQRKEADETKRQNDDQPTVMKKLKPTQTSTETQSDPPAGWAIAYGLRQAF